MIWSLQKPLRTLTRLVLGAAVLVALSRGGDWLAAAFHLPVPGPVLGMLALLAALFALPRAARTVAPAADLAMAWLGALIVPAAAGIVLFGPLLQAHGAALGVVLVTTTLATGACVALIYRAAAQ